MKSGIFPTRGRILTAGLNLMSEAGLSGVTLGILAEQTGLSKSGLFAHFKSKEELQIALLHQMTTVATAYIVVPALDAPEGLPRLETLVGRWLGWSSRAGLRGGCPIAAAIFEMDDLEGPVRERALALEGEWRGLLSGLVHDSVRLGHLRGDLDVDQLVFELCGIYLSHHASSRFVRDPNADTRAQTAFQSLLARSRPDAA